jgi:hypothetical protein
MVNSFHASGTVLAHLKLPARRHSIGIYKRNCNRPFQIMNIYMGMPVDCAATTSVLKVTRLANELI